MKKLILLICFLVPTYFVFSQNKLELDNQHQLLRSSLPDSARVKVMNKIAYQYRSANTDSVKFYAEMVISVAQNNDCCHAELSFALGLLSGHYKRKQDFAVANDYLLQALEIDEKMNYKENLIFDYIDIGNLYVESLDIDKALEYYEKALQIGKASNDPKLYATTLYNYGITCVKLKKYSEAEKIFNEGININLPKDIYRLGTLLYGLGRVYMLSDSLKNSDLALEHTQKSLEIFIKENNNSWQCNSYIQIGDIHRLKKNYTLALQHYQKALQISQYKKYADLSIEIYDGISKLFYDQKDIVKAYKYQLKYSLGRDSLEQQRKIFSISQTQRSYQTRKRNKEILLEKEQKEEQRNFFIGIASFLVLSAMGLSWTIYQKLKSNQLLNQQKEEIELQTQKLQSTNQQLNSAYSNIHRKNADLTSSIIYAQRIQKAILPFKEQLEESFGKDNFFVLFQPKDIVSGDFYWFEEIQNLKQKITFVAVADCTGHGVPGAFMSMIGNQLLHEIIIKNQTHVPNLILNELHKEVHRVLRQKETNTKDGMDICLIAIHKNQLSDRSEILTKIEYSGAMNSLFYVQNSKLEEIKATKRSIGGSQFESERFFENNEILLDQTPLTLYLCSDGYQDQFGGKENRKFMVRQMKRVFGEISEKPMPEQGKILLQTIQNWIAEGRERQIDDMTIMGLKL
ncbi:MAG: hypothetical protein EAZ97_06935 [Bacteroidetes bacterium]|nr:MAG: hypothetical protein EAZ97_06935 [Bacteroidota bacterium]